MTLLLATCLSQRDVSGIQEAVESRVDLGNGHFEALCLDHPDSALYVLNKYDRRALPKQLPRFTITAMGFNPKHEDVLIKLVELDMCRECPNLLHFACQVNYPRLVQMLLARDADVTKPDVLGNRPLFYAEQNQKKYASGIDQAQIRANAYILEYLRKAGTG